MDKLENIQPEDYRVILLLGVNLIVHHQDRSM